MPCSLYTARCFYGSLGAYLGCLIVMSLIVTLVLNRLQRGPARQIMIAIIRVNVHFTCELTGTVGGNFGDLELLV